VTVDSSVVPNVEHLEEADSLTDSVAAFGVDPSVVRTAVPPEMEEPDPSADQRALAVVVDPSAIPTSVPPEMEEPDPRAVVVAVVAGDDPLAVRIFVQPELEGLDPQVGPSSVVVLDPSTVDQVVGPLGLQGSGSSAAAVMVGSRVVPNVEQPKAADSSIDPRAMIVDPSVVPIVVPPELEEPGPSVVAAAAVGVEDPLAIPFAALFEVEMRSSLVQETNPAVPPSLSDRFVLPTKEVVEPSIRVEEA
jgi:hypothetical protein